MSVDSFECEVMDWNLFYVLSKQVAKKVNSSGYKPDLIIGLARGGWILARVLCDLMDVKDLVSLKVEHWGVTATPDGKAKLKYPFNIDLTGKRVLVVDDITDTGESMHIAVDYIQSLKPSEIKTATLRHITGSKFVPDYFAEEIAWRWVIFPWNFTEDMSNIIPKILKLVGSDADVAQIKCKLKQLYTIDITEETIEEILQELKRRGLIYDDAKTTDLKKLVKDKLETCFPTVPKEKIKNASEKITCLARQLSSMPLCESAAIGVGFSIRAVAKEIANDNGLETGTVYDIIMSMVESMKN
jgi:hypoxanthine phosphoribosyltransferase